MFQRACVCAGESAFVCASACVRELECEFTSSIARGYLHICAFSCIGAFVCG